MKLRPLKDEDAAPMLEWMHDPFVVSEMHTDFASKTEADCLKFIHDQYSGKNLHLAIATDDDEYMGTVSLRNIRYGSAEFAITVRKKAMGQGYASFGMKKIIEIAFDRLGLKRVYWCVAPENARAVRFYEKNGYLREKAPVSALRRYTKEETAHYLWYMVRKEQWENPCPEK